MNLFDYLDYREFLKDYYQDEKSKKPFFSFRYMGRKVGLDGSFLARLMQGKSHLTPAKTKSVIEFLELNVEEALYFETLVLFSKAKSDKEAKIYFEKLLSHGQVKTKTIERYQYEFYNKWYYSAVRSLIGVAAFKGSYKELANKLNPTITVKEAKKAIEVLTSLKLIEKDKKGFYHLKEAHITTGRDFTSLAVRNFQKEMIRLAGEAHERHKKDQRHITSMTVAMDKEALEDIRQITNDYLDTIKKRIQGVKESDRVYQMNLQVFPLSQKVDKS